MFDYRNKHASEMVRRHMVQLFVTGYTLRSVNYH